MLFFCLGPVVLLYIEITRANMHLAPADYERKQTLANAERFTTPELKDYERKVLDAEEKILTLERELFADVRQRTAAQAQRIRSTATAVAELDVTAALAQVAAENRYERPTFSRDGEMRIMAGRHPVIERLADQEAGRFIPNDLYLNDFFIRLRIANSADTLYPRSPASCRATSALSGAIVQVRMCSSNLPSAVVTESASLCGAYGFWTGGKNLLRNSRFRASSGIGCGSLSRERSPGATRTTICDDRNTSSPCASRSCVHPCNKGFPTIPYPGAAVAASLLLLMVMRTMFGAKGTSEMIRPSRCSTRPPLWAAASAGSHTATSVPPRLHARSFFANRRHCP